VVELWKIVQFSGYDVALEDMLHDQLVFGVNDSRIQQRLLTETELTFKKAFNIAQAIETAEKDSKDMSTTQGQAGINRVHKATGTTCQPICYHCKRHHNPATCKFKDA